MATATGKAVSDLLGGFRRLVSPQAVAEEEAALKKNSRSENSRKKRRNKRKRVLPRTMAQRLAATGGKVGRGGLAPKAASVVATSKTPKSSTKKPGAGVGPAMAVLAVVVVAAVGLAES